VVLMAYGTPANPVAGTVITVAYQVANVLDPIRWLRAMSGGADPPGSNYVVVSSSTSTTGWGKVSTDVIADAAVSDAKLQAQKVNRAGDVMTGDLTVSRAGGGQPGQGVLYLGQTGGLRYLYWDGSAFQLIGGPLNVGAGAQFAGDILTYRSGATGEGALYLGLTINTAYLRYDGANYQFGGGFGNTAQLFRAGNRVWDAGNDGPGSGLDADLLDGMQPGNGANQIPISNGQLCASLNAQLLAGRTAGNATQQVPVSNGVLCDGLNASQLGGQGSTYYAPASHTHAEGGSAIPAGLIAAFATASAVPAGWTRYTAADGRVMMGAGSTFGQTFTENTSAGAGSWTHNHGIGTYSVAVQSGGVGPVSSGSGSNAIAGHGHTFSGTGGDSTWIPPCRVVVWAQKG
jgi:hypothetical protein